MTRVVQAPTKMDHSSRSETGSEARLRSQVETDRCDTCGEKTADDEKEDEKQNTYTTKKSFLSGLLDITLVVANAAYLYAVIDSGRDGNSYYWYLVVLICSSLLLQVVLFIFLLWLAVTKLCKTGKNPKCHRYNNITVVLTIVITVIDLIIVVLILIARTQMIIH